MKYKVIKVFRDKISKKRYIVGELYETDDEIRANELISKGYLEGKEVAKEGNPVLKQNVNKIKETITESFTQEELNSLLAEEQQGDNRKGVIEHIQSLLKGAE